MNVSILVFLELAPGHPDDDGLFHGPLVSILVFLELAPGRWNPAFTRADKISFNPCFSGTRARTFATSRNRLTILVSILVFLELAPGLNSAMTGRGMTEGFNPCFSGTRARTLVPSGDEDEQLPFQSLFFWNSRPDVEDVPFPADVDLFQSLFFWNSRPDEVVLRVDQHRVEVSILVFLELAPGHRIRITSPYTPDVSILVFLELAPGQSSSWTFRANPIGFNPCFSGTRARTLRGLCRATPG